MSEYDIQAADFLKKSGTKMTISRIGEVHGFPGDPDDSMWRYKYQVVITRNRIQHRFTFYDSHDNWKQNKRAGR